MKSSQTALAQRSITSTEGASLALYGGTPVRSEPLPLDFPGTYFFGAEENDLVSSVLNARSPFRYYGHELQHITKTLEDEFAAFIGMPHALAVNSGTSALTVAMMAMGVGPGSEVIVPGYMWVSTVAAVVRLGAIPILAEIDQTFCLDPHDVKRKITPRTRLIVSVHMNGASGNIEELAALCCEKEIALLEDVAQAAGASVNGKMLGSFGDVSIFSFQLNKTMTSGEGGMVCTSTQATYERAFAAHDLGYARDKDGRLDLSDRDNATWGCGSRMSELTAAVALAQLRKLPQICRSMRQRKTRLQQDLSEIDGLQFRHVDDCSGEAGTFLITVFPDEQSAQFFQQALHAEGIRTGAAGKTNVHMPNWGLHLYYNIPALVEKLSVSGGNNPWTDPRNSASGEVGYAKGTLPKSDDLFSRSLLFAIPPILTDSDLQDISQAFHKIVAACPLAASGNHESDRSLANA